MAVSSVSTPQMSVALGFPVVARYAVSGPMVPIAALSRPAALVFQFGGSVIGLAHRLRMAAAGVGMVRGCQALEAPAVDSDSSRFPSYSFQKCVGLPAAFCGFSIVIGVDGCQNEWCGALSVIGAFGKDSTGGW